MPLRTDPLDELAIPDGTTVEEHDLVTDGDVIVGGQSTVEFGIRGNHVIGGERVRFGGDIEAEGDCRLDMWSDVDGNVLVGRDAYLGERVHVDGQLMVSGDLDIGDDVDIEDGFEANGWIVIRNPMPTIVFLFVYLSHLLRIGEEEAAEDVMSQMTDGDEREHDPVLIPRNASVSDDAWRVSTPATVGDDCRLHGNIRAESLTIGEETELFGSLRARETISIGRSTEVHGDVTTRNGTVGVAPDVHVWGDISADDVVLHETAVVEGSIRARGEMSLVSDESPAEATGRSGERPQESPSQADDELEDDEPEERDETTTEETQATGTERDEEPDAITEPTNVESDEPVETDLERVTADGPESDSDHAENGHEDPVERNSTGPHS